MIPLKKPDIGPDEIAAVTQVMSNGVIAQGPETAEFEREFAQWCGVKHAVAVNSGTAAIHCLLAAHGIGAGDEVITTPFSFIATVSPVLMCGATPVFADIDADTFNLSLDSVRARISEKTRAIIAVDLFGLCADWDALQAFADEHDLVLIEDGCQAHGAKIADRQAGGFGRGASFSFYATKNMTTAEGGMVTTNHQDVADFARSFRHHGQPPGTRYTYAHLGYNYRTTDIASAIGRVQLGKLDGWTARRREIAARFDAAFAELDGLVVPTVPSGYAHAYHLYTLRVAAERRDAVIKAIQARDVGCGVYYPLPLYAADLFRDRNFDPADYPNTEAAAKQVFSIPCEPFMSDADVDAVIAAVKGALEETDEESK